VAWGFSLSTFAHELLERRTTDVAPAGEWGPVIFFPIICLRLSRRNFGTLMRAHVR
jgi:hypothetical protein